MASELVAMFGDEFPVNLENTEDVLEEEHGPLNKISRPYENVYSNAVNATGSSGLLNYHGDQGFCSWMDMRKSGDFTPSSEFPVNLESARDVLEEEHGPLNKRSRLWSSATKLSPIQPTNYNLHLGEPSRPLGLSFTESGDSKALKLKKESKCVTTALVGATMKTRSNEKPKACNFPATHLKIGQWEYKSRYVNDLVAKFYFATRKLDWEVMEQGLKSKIEIEWSNIIALKTNCPQYGPGTLTLVLAKQPLFFRKTKLQYRKPISWEKTTDFTYGQASMNRHHFLQCAEGIMTKHIEKLVQFDLRLSHLCRQPEIPMDHPYFEEHAPDLNKRSRLWSSATIQPTNYNLIGEPSRPLGLSLRKIQKRLRESGDSKALKLKADGASSGLDKESKGIATSSVEAVMKPRSNEKPKASHFPATLLKIGQWEYKSRGVNGLVAKFYFARRKLVWEVLEKGLKSKMEIEWSDIVALKANCPQHGPGTLTLVLAKQPLFFREPKPTHRKQTMWQKTTDFTFGHASMNKKHILQCGQGIMNTHIEKLVQFDHRLFLLCRQPEILMDSPYFEDPRRDDSKETQNVSTFPSIFGTQNIPSPVESQASCEHMYLPHEAPSPNSVANEGTGSAETVNTRKDCVQNEVLGLEQ